MDTEFPIAARIRRKITEIFQPLEMALVDESDKHHGHAGARPEGETHFRLTIVSPLFHGVDRLTRQRQVYAVLKEEMTERVHALSLFLKTPEENGL